MDLSPRFRLAASIVVAWMICTCTAQPQHTTQPNQASTSHRNAKNLNHFESRFQPPEYWSYAGDQVQLRDDIKREALSTVTEHADSLSEQHFVSLAESEQLDHHTTGSNLGGYVEEFKPIQVVKSASESKSFNEEGSQYVQSYPSASDYTPQVEEFKPIPPPLSSGHSERRVLNLAGQSHVGYAEGDFVSRLERSCRAKHSLACAQRMLVNVIDNALSKDSFELLSGVTIVRNRGSRRVDDDTASGATDIGDYVIRRVANFAQNHVLRVDLSPITSTARNARFLFGLLRPKWLDIFNPNAPYAGGYQQPVGTLPAASIYVPGNTRYQHQANAKVSYVADNNNNGNYYQRHQPNKQDYKVFHDIPSSSLLLTTYDPFYSPLLSRLDSVFKQLGYDTEKCRERLVCAMYRNPAKFAPYSNLVSAQLSRELNELRKPASDNSEILRFFRYMKAAKNGQDGQDCYRLHPGCVADTAVTHPPMVKTYNDINKLVQARRLARQMRGRAHPLSAESKQVLGGVDPVPTESKQVSGGVHPVPTESKQVSGGAHPVPTVSNHVPAQDEQVSIETHKDTTVAPQHTVESKVNTDEATKEPIATLVKPVEPSKVVEGKDEVVVKTQNSAD